VSGTSQRRNTRVVPSRALRDDPVSWSLFGFSVLAVLFMVLLVISPWARHQLALSFTRVPDTYTELYFVGSPPVSSTDLADRRQVRVNFMIANHESDPTQYSYLVQVLDAAGAPVGQREDSISVADGEQRPNQVAVVLPAGRAWSTVTVNLLHRREAIHYTAPDTRIPEN
jgi:hypothetical protein